MAYSITNNSLQDLTNSATRQFRLRKMRVVLKYKRMCDFRGRDLGVLGTCDLMGRDITLYKGCTLETLAHEIAHQRHVLHNGWHRNFTLKVLDYLEPEAVDMSAEDDEVERLYEMGEVI